MRFLLDVEIECMQLLVVFVGDFVWVLWWYPDLVDFHVGCEWFWVVG